VSISKFVGGLLLIVGTSIGGGMLALPIATAQAGFMHSIIFLILCWAIMTSGALLVLEVNLRLPAGSNMVTMAKTTLGLPGQIIAWITYLFLLYSLLAGYISGGSDVLGVILSKSNIHISDNLNPLIFTTVFAYIVYSGIRAVDYVNRGLMFGKLGVYLLLIIIISPHVTLSKLQTGDVSTISKSVMILITSFGFATIVPSLRDYFKGDIVILRRLIVLGSFIPLVCYILWDAVIMGSLDHQGTYGLLNLASSKHAISGLADALKHAANNPWINGFYYIYFHLYAYRFFGSIFRFI
jgi:tyrosine-specific transport protein